jgi:hypothetical protein
MNSLIHTYMVKIIYTVFTTDIYLMIHLHPVECNKQCVVVASFMLSVVHNLLAIGMGFAAMNKTIATTLRTLILLLSLG